MLTVSAIAVLGIATFFCIRTRATGVGAAVVLFLFGFFVAGTGAYGPIHSACASIAHVVANLRT